jgi:hypothetical protein
VENHDAPDVVEMAVMGLLEELDAEGSSPACPKRLANPMSDTMDLHPPPVEAHRTTESPVMADSPSLRLA